MVIDMHVHPIFYKSICDNKEELEFRKDTFGVWKQGPMDWDEAFAEMDFGGIDKEALLPMDVTTTEGGWIVTNEQIAALKSRYPERLIGFASVDPHRKDAADVLIHAFDDLGLEGLKLHPSKQKFYPADPCMEPIYEICESRNKPIIFHAGTSWEPNTPAEYDIRWPLRRCSSPIPICGAAWPILPGPGCLGDGHAHDQVSQRIHRYLRAVHGFPGGVHEPPVHGGHGAPLV